jgi:Flp pilus assembly pilin Flp
VLDRLRRRLRPAAPFLDRVLDESGQGLAEYALILSLIAVATVGILGTLGQGIAALVGWTLFQNL